MNTQLLEIYPRELKFLFEVKKQSSCAVHLTNLTDQYVAFKVKTTSPKKYCVRPNVGVIKPKTTCDFTVTMQAQKSAMVDCKDKFLIQSTVVPYGTNEEDITSSMFSKETQKYVEETKLRVVLTSAPSSDPPLPPENVLRREPLYDNLKPQEHSPILSPVNGVKQEVKPKEASPVLSPVGVSKQVPETVILNDNLHNEVENVPPDTMLRRVGEPIYEQKEESQSVNTVDNIMLNRANIEEHIMDDHQTMQPIDAIEAKIEVKNDAEELRSKIATLVSKLSEAEDMIMKLKEEKSTSTNQNKKLKQDLETLTRTVPHTVRRKVHVGFPPLFVCAVALICFFMGCYWF